MNNAVFGKTMENTDVAKDAEARVDSSDSELERPLPKEKNRKSN